MELAPAEFALRDCVADALSPLAARAAENKLELVCRIAPDVPDSLVGDEGRLRQVIVNLAGNAVKFTTEGEVMLHVTLHQKTESECSLQFSICDTGIGVAPEKQGMIFEPFEQEDGTTTRRFGGTGLGLAISLKLVELMGGRIWLESPRKRPAGAERGPGSEFHFTARFDQTRNRAVRPFDGEGRRVLIVDNNASTRAALSEAVAQWGLIPECVENGPAGLEFLAAALRSGNPFQGALVDSGMPEMDGLDLLRLIRQHPGMGELSAILVCSPGTRLDTGRFREASPDASLH